MALFQQQKDPSQEIVQLRSQGLTDDLIMGELTKRGYSPDQVHAAVSQLDAAAPAPGMNNLPGPEATAPSAMGDEQNPLSGRIEEIAESIIDEKWDELIAEVKKIIEWKEKVEEKQNRMINDLTKLKEDFKVLHGGVLGKLEDYDTRMRDVGTELKAVGKVFKDVVPEFVENVKELSHLTGKVKNK